MSPLVLFRPAKITVDAAIRDLGSKDPRVRAAAADALADVPEADRARAARALLGVLGDERYEVRCSATLALGDLADPTSVETLIEKLDDPHSAVRQSAAIALGRIGDARAFDRLAELLRDGPADLRFQAAASLAEIDPARAYDPLVAAVGDGDPEVRANVAAALGEIGDGRAAGWIADLLDDPSEEARFEAAFALARMKDARALEPLVKFLDHRVHGWEALEGLEMIGDRRAAPHFAARMRRLLSPRQVRVRAAAALLTVAPDHADAGAARALLDRAARAWREDVRGLAREALERLAARGEGASEPPR